MITATVDMAEVVEVTNWYFQGQRTETVINLNYPSSDIFNITADTLRLTASERYLLYVDRTTSHIYFLFVCDLFNDAVSSSEYIASKDVEGVVA
jgi:hypothetical protein